MLAVNNLKMKFKILFMVAFENMKFSGINFTNYVQYLYSKSLLNITERKESSPK